MFYLLLGLRGLTHPPAGRELTGRERRRKGHALAAVIVGLLGGITARYPAAG